MLVPLSWINEYTTIKLPLKSLMWKMTEVGLTTEKFEKDGREIILDVEVTPNRPDWLSIVGVAREIAAIQNTKLTLPRIPELAKPKHIMPIKLNPDFKIIERWSAVVISGVTVGPSPSWLLTRLKQVGLRPINNIVDITNYVMFEFGVPMHAFDYDTIEGHTMTPSLARGGERFTSVDDISYKLPEDAMIIKDAKRIIDLVGIKGGLNSGITEKTKNIFLHVTIDNPVLTRRASIAMGLRSEASAIYERGPDKGGTLNSLKRVSYLILDIAGGEVASNLIDLKQKDFAPWQLALSLKKLEKVLGVKLPEKTVVRILQTLNLDPIIKNGDKIICTIPTYRGDLKIEEDLIEEVARLYGYNNFPKTLPKGPVKKEKVPYFSDREWEVKLKNLLLGAGFSEAITLSLISKDLILASNLSEDSHIKIANPVSLDYEYLRTSLVPSLLAAVKENAGEEEVKFFEYNKIYLGPLGKTKEPYKLAVVTSNGNYRKLKGILDFILKRLGISNVEVRATVVRKGLWHPTHSGVVEKEGLEIGTIGEIHPEVVGNLKIMNPIFAMELDAAVLKSLRKKPIFKSLPKFPPQVEDITLKIPEGVKVASVIAKMLDHKLITKAELAYIYNSNYTFRIWYQHPEKTLTDEEVRTARAKVTSDLEKMLGLKN